MIPWLYNYLPVFNAGHLWLRLALALWRDGDRSGDAQLGRVHVEGTHGRLSVTLCASMDDSTQTPPDDYAARGDDLCAGVHVANDNHVALISYTKS